MQSPVGLSPRGGPMTSPLLPFEDLGLRLTPTEVYRCPVSTPATRGHRYRRTKPVVDAPTSQPVTQSRAHSPGSVRRSLPAPTANKTNKKAAPRSGWEAKVSQALDYYWVDKSQDSPDHVTTHTHWLNSLVSQPVSEILNKYRRKTDLKRTQVLWSKTFTTPGEKNLLTAWNSNTVSGRGQTPQSAKLGGAKSRASTHSLHMTRSEPSQSRAQYEHRALTPSAGSPIRSVIGASTSPSSPCTSPELMSETHQPSAGRNRKCRGGAKSGQSASHVKTFNGSLLDVKTEKDSRVTSYTTKYIKKLDGSGKEKIFTKVTWGGEKMNHVTGGGKVTPLTSHLSQSKTCLPKIYSESKMAAVNVETGEKVEEGADVMDVFEPNLVAQSLHIRQRL